jgi:putative ABC transport system permease protein
MEAAALALLGAALGLALVTLGLWLAEPLLAAHWGLFLTQLAPSGPEWLMLLAVVVTGTLAGLWPAWRAQRISLAQGLCPRL